MKATANVQSGYLCHCLRITVEDYEEMLRKSPNADYAALKAEFGIGTMCSSCEYEAKGILVEKSGSQRRAGPATAERAPRLIDRLKSTAWDTARAIGLAKPKIKRKTYYTGIFFMRKDGLESRLAVSNIKFPEHERNANGGKVEFTAALYGDGGKKITESKKFLLRDGASAELGLEDLFPGFREDFVGSLYIDFPNLAQTGSLRPYGILTASSAQARCHYHDKFGYFREPGYVQNTSPFEPDQICWMAVSNCQDRAYESEVFLKIGGRKLSASISLPPMASRWIKLEDLFGAENLPPAAERSPALFWLENPQHVMVYFFWFNTLANTWTGQHH